LDGELFGEPIGALPKPFMILVEGRGPSRDQQSLLKMTGAHHEAHSFPEARHMNFSDAGILPSRFPIPKSVLLLGNTDGRTFIYSISDLLRQFFDGM
jgi:hypothetical protein